MTTESIQATAENLRADFMNATTTAERWKVLNRAIDWAVAASGNAAHERAMRYEISDAMLATAKREAALTQAQTPSVTVEAYGGVTAERVAQIACAAAGFHQGGVVQGSGARALVGEKVEGQQKVLHPGEAFRHPDYPNEMWVVLSGRFGRMVEIAPLADDCEMRKYLTRPENLFA